MALKLMYITNQTEVAQIAQACGVDRIFVDMEYIGKKDRQGGMDTVQSFHTVEDIRRLRSVVDTAELLVRCNPIHEAGDVYSDSETEIREVIEAGADIIMLPYFKTVEEVEQFLQIVNGRTKTMLLVETAEAVSCIDEILELPGIDEVYIGLNDLSLGMKRKFMFELLADGTVEQLALKFRQAGYPFGFGGIASLGKGMLPAEYIIREHYRMQSSSVILSRSFLNTSLITDIEEIRRTFEEEVQKLRQYEKEVEVHADYFWDNYKQIKTIIKGI